MQIMNGENIKEDNLYKFAAVRDMSGSLCRYHTGIGGEIHILRWESSDLCIYLLGGIQSIFIYLFICGIWNTIFVKASWAYLNFLACDSLKILWRQKSTCVVGRHGPCTLTFLALNIYCNKIQSYFNYFFKSRYLT